MVNTHTTHLTQVSETSQANNCNIMMTVLFAHWVWAEESDITVQLFDLVSVVQLFKVKVPYIDTIWPQTPYVGPAATH